MISRNLFTLIYVFKGLHKLIFKNLDLKDTLSIITNSFLLHLLRKSLVVFRPCVRLYLETLVSIKRKYIYSVRSRVRSLYLSLSIIIFVVLNLWLSCKLIKGELKQDWMGLFGLRKYRKLSVKSQRLTKNPKKTLFR